MWKCSEDSKKVLYMSLSQTVAELGLIIKRVLYSFFRPLDLLFKSVFYSRASYNSENTVYTFSLVFQFLIMKAKIDNEDLSNSNNGFKNFNLETIKVFQKKIDGTIIAGPLYNLSSNALFCIK